MTKLLLYVEGGNKGADAHEMARLRESWRYFFREIDPLYQGQVDFKVTLCSGIESTFKIFQDACLRRLPTQRCLLLVDSDGALVEGACPKAFLGKVHSTWQLPPREGAEVYHCMVQTFESWLLADREAAAAYFGCDPASLPDERSVDGLSKKRLGEILAAACGRKYDKIKDGAALLKKVDPAKVQAHSPHCRRLFENLRAALAA